MNYAGQIYKALYIPPETPSLTDEQRDQLILNLAVQYDLRSCMPKTSAGKMKKTCWAWMNESVNAARRDQGQPEPEESCMEGAEGETDD